MLLLLMLLTTVSAWAWDGQGTEASPYEIKSVGDLNQLATDVNGGTNYNNVYFRQTADIELSGEWTPIGTATNPFKGHYDGGGYAITGLQVTGSYQYAGLFGVIASGDYVPQKGYFRQAVLKDINIVECNINVGSGGNAGGIAGKASTIDMSGCRVSGTITGFGFAGGLIGYIDQTSGVKVTDCFVDVSVTSPSQYYPQVRLMAYVSGGSPTTSGNYCHDRIGSVSPGISATSLYTVTGAPSGVTVAETNATLTFNATPYFATGATATLTVDANHMFNTFSVSGTTNYNVASDKKSATVTIASSDATVTVTLQTIGGSCGTNATWAVTDTDNNGTYETLTISGTGAMNNYSSSSSIPWYSYKANITTVVIGGGVTSIGSNAFVNCSALTSVTIPNSVTSIGFRAFEGCSALSSIEIPANVTSIGGEAFSDCTGLTSIEIPANVTSIGGEAFSDCTGLTSIEIPASVTSIGYEAFYGCSSLASVTLKRDTPPSLGSSAFDDCTLLNAIYVPSSALTAYQGADNWSAYKGKMQGYDGTCGDNVYYLYNSSTKTLNIFGSGAMKACPDDPEKLPWNSLTTVVIGNGVTHIGDYAFMSCTGLTSLTFGNSVTSIGERAFGGCIGLTSITFGNSVTSIGECAFEDCTGLTSVTFPANLTSIGDWAFYNCEALTSITFGNSVTSIGYQAFSGCTSLTSIEIPASVTSIGSGVFSACTGLASISVASGNTKYHSDGNCIIETATKTLIQGCKTSVIPTGVTSIVERAFSGCTGLASITIPNSVTSIGDYAFDDCTSLTSITIPNSVTSIGDGAFFGCTGLTSIEIPASVTSIGYWAFEYCTSLTSIEIPASVTSIDDWAFRDCSALTSVTIYAPSLTTYGIDAFGENAAGRKIYVFSDCVDTYKGKTSKMGISQNDILPITLTANPGDKSGEYWTTYYNDMANAKVPSGAQAFKVTLSGTTLTLKEITDGIITKGEAVVIKSTSASVLPEYSATGSSDTNDNNLKGTMKRITNPNYGKVYVLNNKSAGIGFYKLSATGAIAAHKAYLEADGTTAPEFFGLDGDTTGVNEVRGQMEDVRGEYYDLSGRRLSGQPTQKGLYIVNGRKVVVK